MYAPGKENLALIFQYVVDIGFQTFMCTGNYDGATFMRAMTSVGKSPYDSTQCYLNLTKLQERYA